MLGKHSHRIYSQSFSGNICLLYEKLLSFNPNINEMDIHKTLPADLH